MSDDIVARLRAVLHNDRSVELMNREAADEIERLRAERDEARKERDEARKERDDAQLDQRLIDELWQRRTDAGVANLRIRKLEAFLKFHGMAFEEKAHNA